MFELLIFLIFGHCIGDFALQSEWVAVNKAKEWYIMFSHVMIWTGVLSFILLYFNEFTISKAIFLSIGHIIMDSYKCRQDEWWYIYPDQAWHILQCIIVYSIL